MLSPMTSSGRSAFSSACRLSHGTPWNLAIVARFVSVVSSFARMDWAMNTSLASMSDRRVTSLWWMRMSMPLIARRSLSTCRPRRPRACFTGSPESAMLCSSVRTKLGMMSAEPRNCVSQTLAMRPSISALVSTTTSGTSTSCGTNRTYGMTRLNSSLPRSAMTVPR